MAGQVNIEVMTTGFSAEQEQAFSEGYAVASDPTARVRFGGSAGHELWGPNASINRDAESVQSSGWLLSQPTDGETIQVTDPAFFLAASVRAFEIASSRLQATVQEGN